MVEKSKSTVHLKPAAPAAKPEQKQAPKSPPPPDAGEPKDTAQAEAVTQEAPKRERVPLRAKKVLNKFEQGFLAAIDAAKKTAFEHERARSVGTPITDAIDKLEPDEAVAGEE